MGLFSGIKKIGKKAIGGLSKAVRGVGRIARGKFGQGLGDIAGGVKGVLPAAALAFGGAGLLGAGPLAGALGGVGSSAAGAAGKLGIPKLAGGALKFLKANPDVALAGVGMISNARNQSRADRIRSEQLEAARARQAQLAPLWDTMIGRLGSMSPPAGGAVGRVPLRDPGNPYSR